MRPSGWAINATSSSDGETWTPETLSVSFILSIKLPDVRLRQDLEQKASQGVTRDLTSNFPFHQW